MPAFVARGGAVAGAAEIADVIRAAAEGAGGSVAALQAAGVAVALDDFAVEIRWDGERNASIVVSIALGQQIRSS
jgi:hypothetical protein